MLVHKSVTDDFLQLARARIPLQNRRKILADIIKANAQLHNEDVVHLGITLPCEPKSLANVQQTPSPAMLWPDCAHGEHGTTVKSIQLTDLGDAAYLPSRA